MTSTIIVVCVFLGMLLVSFLLWGLLLRLGLCWAKVADVTARRIVLATAIVITLQIAINAVSFYLSVSAIAQSTAFHLLELAVGVIVPSAVISVLFKARFLRSIQAWLPTLLATVVLLLFIHFVSRPFLYELSLSQQTQCRRRWSDSIGREPAHSAGDRIIVLPKTIGIFQPSLRL